MRLCLAILLGCLSLACTNVPPSQPGSEEPPADVFPVEDPIAEPPEPEPVAGWPALQKDVPELRLDLDPADLAALYAREDREFRVPGTLTADGQRYPAQVRLRGRSSMNFEKKSFEVELDPPARVDGRKQLALLAEWKDAGYLTQKVWYDLAAAQGLRVPRVRYVFLVLNGAPYGVMVDIEKVDKAFLANHGFDPSGDIYRCGQNDCELRDDPRDPDQDPWEKKTHESEPWDGLWDFLRGLNRTPPQDFGDWLESSFELDEYLKWLAVDAVISNTVIEDSRSYLVFDRVRARWSYVPWDLNNAHSLYRRTRPIETPPKINHPLLNYTAYDSNPEYRWSVLNTRIADDEKLRARLVQEIEALLDTRFTEEELGARIRATHALLSPYYARDPFVDRLYAERAADYLMRYLEGRREYLQDWLPTLARHGRTALKIDRVGRDASGRLFVDLVNAGSSSQSLAGLLLTGRLRQPTQWALPALTLAPGAKVRFSEGAMGEAFLGATLEPDRVQVGLFPAAATVPIDALFLGRLNPGEARGRVPSGKESFGDLPADAP